MTDEGELRFISLSELREKFPHARCHYLTMTGWPVRILMLIMFGCGYTAGVLTAEVW